MTRDFHRTALVTATRDISFDEMLRHISQFASLTPGEQGSRTIIFAENREGWVYALYAVWAKGGIAVPVDASSTVEDLAFIAGDCKPTAVWTTESLRATAASAIGEAGVEAEILVIDEHEGQDPNAEPARVDRNTDDTAVIMYTSGTTGKPKGVMLSFANLLANVLSVSRDVPIFNERRRTMILLPLHHVLPLLGTIIAPFYCGGGVTISPSMTAADIINTMQRGKVGIIVGVPRLWQTLLAGIMKQINSNFAARALYRLCARVGSRSLSRLVFRSVRKRMGGHIVCCASGGAALDKEIGKGLITLGLDVVEGYGMTETSPIITFTRPGDFIPGCSGKPLPGLEVKLVDGEICAKGPNLMQGYYNRPEETAAAIDSDGFLHTGDLGEFDAEGRLYVTGRKKELIVLSNGKNVQPNEIETKLESFAEHVKEAAVAQKGDILCAIVVPQDAMAEKLTDNEIAERIKREVLEPYNRATENYKRVLDLVVWRKPLPRTRLEKLKRYQLGEIIAQTAPREERLPDASEPDSPEYRIIKRYIEEEKRMTPRPTDNIETDLAFDSLDKVSLQGFIEQTFGTRVNANEMGDFPTLAALVEHVARAKTQMEVHHVNWHELMNTSDHELTLPTSTVLFPMASATVRLFARIYNRLELHGLENIPDRGPYILAPNHQSYLDGGLVLCGLRWRNVSKCYFYATEEHVASPLTRFLARHSNVVVMELGNLKDSIQKLAQVLRNKKSIIIFPEGSRTHTGEIGPFKKTFAILSLELGVPIIPVRISGAYDALPRSSSFVLPKKIRVEYLPPIVPHKDSTYDELTTQTRDAIAAIHRE